MRSIRLTVASRTVTVDTIKQVAGDRASRVKQFIVQQADDDGYDEVAIDFVRLSQASVDEIAGRLRALPGVKSLTISV